MIEALITIAVFVLVLSAFALTGQLRQARVARDGWRARAEALEDYICQTGDAPPTPTQLEPLIPPERRAGYRFAMREARREREPRRLRR